MEKVSELDKPMWAVDTFEFVFPSIDAPGLTYDQAEEVVKCLEGKHGATIVTLEAARRHK